MPRDMHTLTAADILPTDAYQAVRTEKRGEAIARKQITRLAIGPFATILFETWDSMWLQVQEMLRIEKGGAEQLVDELAAYGPMVPKGDELTATLLFEVADPARRDAFLRTIGGVENHVALRIGGEVIRGREEGEVERTRASDGKASAVHFLHFEFTPEQISAWSEGSAEAMVLIDHPNYGHAAMISSATREFLTANCF